MLLLYIIVMAMYPTGKTCVGMVVCRWCEAGQFLTGFLEMTLGHFQVRAVFQADEQHVLELELNACPVAMYKALLCLQYPSYFPPCTYACFLMKVSQLLIRCIQKK